MNSLHMHWGRMACSDVGGPGIPLLFLHGTGCDSTDWDAVVQALPEDTRAVSLDFRGHGLSAVPTGPFTIEALADDVLFLMDRLALPPVLLIGHSLGGMVAMEAADRSTRVAGLVLLEGWTGLSAAGAFGDGRFYGTLSKADIARIQCKSEETRSRFAPQIWEHFWQSVQRFDAYSYLQNARIPILEVYGAMGRNDRTEGKLRVPPNPCIEWMWVPNAGHYLPHERPDAVAAACLKGVERIRQEEDRNGIPRDASPRDLE